MERQRGIKGLSIVALLVAIVGLSIAFAALSTTLTISGSAKVVASTWDIHFTTRSDSNTYATENQTTTLVAEEYGDGSSLTDPTITGTSVSSFSVSLKKPGDYVRYKFAVTNAGDINAYISSITGNDSSITCTAPTAEGTYTAQDKAADEALICGSNDPAKEAAVVYTLKYDSDTNYTNALVAQNNRLLASGTKNLVLEVRYKDTYSNNTQVNEVPKGEVTITIPTITIVYSQTDANSYSY